MANDADLISIGSDLAVKLILISVRSIARIYLCESIMTNKYPTRLSNKMAPDLPLDNGKTSCRASISHKCKQREKPDLVRKDKLSKWPYTRSFHCDMRKRRQGLRNGPSYRSKAVIG